MCYGLRVGPVIHQDTLLILADFLAATIESVIDEAFMHRDGYTGKKG